MDTVQTHSLGCAAAMPAMNPVAGFTGLLLLGLGLPAATTESKSKLGAPELGPEGAGKPELGKSMRVEIP